jgi:hypothetical protein
MQQTELLEITLTEFEQTTFEQYVCCRASSMERYEALQNCNKLKLEVISMVKKWNDKRKAKGLTIWQ